MDVKIEDKIKNRFSRMMSNPPFTYGKWITGANILYAGALGYLCGLYDLGETTYEELEELSTTFIEELEQLQQH